jgi:hypothetical protein
VVITGTNFTGAVAVSFGNAPATAITVNSATQLTVTSPALGSGQVDVTVTTLSGTSATSSADVFTFTGPVAVVTGISPAFGPAAGGTSVTLTQTGFTGATQVYFGPNVAASFVVNSDTSITATTAAGSMGVVDVLVATANGGQSAVAATDQFTFAPTPSITSMTPTSGSTSGGTTVTITGTNFTGATNVLFGTVSASSFTVLSPTQISAVSPAHGQGSIYITVTNGDYTSAAVPASAFYFNSGTLPPMVVIGGGHGHSGHHHHQHRHHHRRHHRPLHPRRLDMQAWEPSAVFLRSLEGFAGKEVTAVSGRTLSNYSVALGGDPIHPTLFVNVFEGADFLRAHAGRAASHGKPLLIRELDAVFEEWAATRGNGHSGN